MITDPPIPPFTPEDLRANFERLQTDLNVVQNELDQALGVWRAILEGEKQELKKLLEDREKDWAHEEAQWQKDRQAYEQKVQELETFFNRQLVTTDRNAVRALNELDAAWQQERSRWQQTVTQQSREARQNEEFQSAAHRQLEQRIAQLTEEKAQLSAHVERIASLEAQLTEWEAEKTSWQQLVSEKDALIQSLQSQLGAMEQRLQETDQTQKNQEQHVHVYMNTLETQVAALEDFVQQVFHPRRRKSDNSSHFPSQTFRPPTPRASQ